MSEVVILGSLIILSVILPTSDISKFSHLFVSSSIILTSS